jgi:hypothetical protein
MMKKRKLFGGVKCYVYAIEWQKRGLPHAHVLVWLEETLHPEQFDKIISAEIPDPVSDPVLFKIVTSQMVHGPCGLAFPKLSCMYKGLCKKKYPRPFCSETNVDRHGYPQYRRRSPAEGGHVKKIGEDGGRGPRYLLDNRNIVPYSPTLCRLFDAHINV